MLLEWWKSFGDRPILLAQLAQRSADPNDTVRNRQVDMFLSAMQGYYPDAVTLDKSKTTPVGIDAHKLSKSLDKYHGRPTGLGPFRLVKSDAVSGGRRKWQLKLTGSLDGYQVAEEETETLLPDNVTPIRKQVKEEVPF